jgi:hypothetical protein
MTRQMSAITLLSAIAEHLTPTVPQHQRAEQITGVYLGLSVAAQIYSWQSSTGLFGQGCVQV